MLRVSGQSAHSWPDVRCRGARRLPWTPWPVLPGVARTLAAAWSRRAGAWRCTGSPRRAEQVGEWWRREARRHPSSQGRARSSRALQLCYQRRADKFLSRLTQKGRLAFFSCARGSCWMLRVVTFFFPPLFYVRVVGSGLLATFAQLCARADVGKVRVLVTPRSPAWSWSEAQQLPPL